MEWVGCVNRLSEDASMSADVMRVAVAWCSCDRYGGRHFHGVGGGVVLSRSYPSARVVGVVLAGSCPAPKGDPPAGGRRPSDSVVVPQRRLVCRQLREATLGDPFPVRGECDPWLGARSGQRRQGDVYPVVSASGLVWQGFWLTTGPGCHRVRTVVAEGSRLYLAAFQS